MLTKNSSSADKLSNQGRMAILTSIVKESILNDSYFKLAIHVAKYFDRLHSVHKRILDIATRLSFDTYFP